MLGLGSLPRSSYTGQTILEAVVSSPRFHTLHADGDIQHGAQPQEQLPHRCRPQQCDRITLWSAFN